MWTFYLFEIVLTCSSALTLVASLIFFFSLHLLFWNQTLTTLADRPVISVSCSFMRASGRGLALKQVLRMFNCFSVRTVRTLPALLLLSRSVCLFLPSSRSPDPDKAQCRRHQPWARPPLAVCEFVRTGEGVSK